MSWSRVRGVVSPLGVVAAVLGASRLEALTRVAPVIGVFRGPLGAVLLVTAAILALVRARGTPRSRPAPRVGPLVLFLAGAGLLIAVGLSYTTRLRVSGDEPHYLLMAQSLWRDHDLDLANNFAQEDYLEYTPGPLRPHYGEPRRDGRPYPAHSPGLPFLLAPVYGLAGRAGCVVLLALGSAVVAARTSALARRLGGDAEVGLWAWAAALGPPLFFYSFHVYTETASAVAALVALELLLAPAPTVAMALGAALAASVLPWLHVKMLLVAAALGVVGLARLRGRPRLAFVLLAAVAAGLYALYYDVVFGRPTPLAIYGGLPADVSGSPGRALLGLLLDRSFGLLPHAPLFLLALPGLVWLTARWRTTWPVLLVAAAVLAPVLPWRMWWGGQCPPGRFLVPLVPLLALAVGFVAGSSGRGLARWKTPLLAWGVALGAFMAHDPGALLLLNRANRPTRVWAALSGDVSIGRYLPSLTLADPVEARVAAVWLAALGLVLALHALARRSDVLDRRFRGLALPVVLFVVVGGAIDGWARPSSGPSPESTPGPAIEEDATEAPGASVR